MSKNMGGLDKARLMVEKFPHSSKKELGKMLYKLYPLVFKDEEAGRSAIRTVTGSNGKLLRNVAGTSTHKEVYKGLPKGIKNDFAPVALDPGKWGVINDVHIPFHDTRAVDLTLEHFYKRGVKNLLLNGDILDCYMASDFTKIPTMPQLKDEFDMLKPWLAFLKKKFNVIYKLGNHEERLERVLIQKAPMLYGWQILSWSALVENIVPIVENKKFITAGSLYIGHGHEFGREQVFNPVNAARGYFLRAKANFLGGDKHATSEHIEPNIKGEIIGTWSVGCLCDLTPLYRPVNKWNLGFAIVEHDGDQFEVTNLKIVNGKVR